ncbi:MAG TPA: DNA polymerase III subunit delta [Tissierellia bacterium]|nr:DNA polymerase III subunit delta [Tissierellia bacterium]
MNYRQFLDSLKTGKLKTVYLFYGEEQYMMDYALKSLKEEFIQESFETLNYIAIEGEEASFERVLNACETLPFMSKKKIVVIKDLPVLTGKKDAQAAGIVDDATLAEYLLELDNYIILVFIVKNKDVNKSNRVYKSISKVGDVVEFHRLKGKELNLWVESRFKAYKRKISNANINYIIQQSQYNGYVSEKTLYDMENEIIKICNYVQINGEVTKDIIDNIMAKTLEMNVFNLLNEISNKRGENAIRLFNEMYMSNKPVLFMLNMIVRQLMNMLQYKIYKEKGYSNKDMLEMMKLSEFEFRKVANQSSNFTITQLENAMKFCLHTDESIKFNFIDERLAMEMLITKLCYKI